jgi:FkbH-like protein
MKYTEILAANKEYFKNVKSPKYSIGILSNIIINSFKDILEYQCLKNNINPIVEIGNYDNIVQDSFIFNNKDLVIIFYDALNIFENIDEFFESVNEDFYNALLLKFTNELDLIFNNLSNTSSVIINTFSPYGFVSSATRCTKIEDFCTELNSYLKDYAPKNFNIINIDKILTNNGIINNIDYRFFHSSKAPYTIEFFNKYVSEIEFVLFKNTGKLKKAIIFDCDNTLWKGILGEDGMEGIDMSSSSKIGKYFNLVQRIVYFLGKKGVIIGLCSKNNEKDVLEVFRSHKDVFLRENDIVIYKINWDDKASNLYEISRELNIGLESILFVDDSSFEINLIGDKLPEVTTLHVPSNLYLYPSTIMKFVYKYFNLNVTIEDINKNLMYKQQFFREQDKKKYNNIDQYLSSLEIEIKIQKDNVNQIERLSQLTQKTNQFNLTTKRYTEVQIEKFMNSNSYYVFSLSVRDKFGDNGITGLCIIEQFEENNKIILSIDTFLMSCRIIGRNIEFAFLDHVISFFNQSELYEIRSSYISSSKNIQVANFYDKSNFTLLSSSSEDIFYKLDWNKYKKIELLYIKVVN